MNIQDFLTQIQVEILKTTEKKKAKESCGFPVHAYTVDKSRAGKGHALKEVLRMSECFCCDYIFVNKDKVLLLEDSNLAAKKHELEKCSFEGEILRYVKEEQDKEEFSQKITEKTLDSIKNEQITKAYASLLLLCRLILNNNDARTLMRNKTVSFGIIVNDATSLDFKAFDNMRVRMRGPLSPFVSEILVLPLKEAKQKLIEYKNSGQ